MPFPHGCENLDSNQGRSGVQMDCKLYQVEKALATKGVCGHVPPGNYFLWGGLNMPSPMFTCEQFHKLKHGKTLSVHTVIHQLLQLHAGTPT